MSSTIEYELLKIEGTWKDRVKYVLSLRDKNELQKYLYQSSSYEDTRMLVFLSKSIKNKENLLPIFKTDSVQIFQRAIAAKAWLKLEKDERQIFKFIVEIVNDGNIARW